MRLLHVSHAIPPEANTGVENYTVQMARHQAEHHEVAVYARGLRTDSDTEERDEAGEFLTVRVPLGPGHHHTHERFRQPQAERFRRFLAQWRPDVVHFQHLIYHSLDYPRIARESGAATVMTLHDFWFSCPQVQRIDYRGAICDRAPGVGCLPCIWEGRRATLISPELVARLARQSVTEKAALAFLPGAAMLRDWAKDSQACFDHLDVVISPSRFLAENILQNGLHPRRLIVTDYGIPVPGPTPAPVQGRSLEDGVRFGVIGTHRLKGLGVAVEAFSQVADTPASLLLYGALPDNLKGSLPENCRAQGRYTAEELEQVFAAFDVLIVPSIWYENAPFVIREAFARNKPVIASDLGGMAESVRHEIDGLLFPVGDAPALAQAVRRLAQEPGLLERLRANIHPPKFYDEHLAELDTIYTEAAGARFPEIATASSGAAQGFV